MTTAKPKQPPVSSAQKARESDVIVNWVHHVGAGKPTKQKGKKR